MSVRTRPLLLAAALLAGTVVPLTGTAAADSSPVPLGLSSLGRIVVDEAHGRVFVSGGPSGPGVMVTDLDGKVQATLPFQGATGLALSPDGSRLWMAQPGFGLASIDPATLIGQERWQVAGCPGDVAVVGDRLVYGYSCNRYSPAGGENGGIGVLDAATGASYGAATDGPHYRPVLAKGPTGQVYAADTGLSPSTLHLYDVSGTAPRKIASRAQVCSNLRDLTASPSGGQVVTSCGSPYRHDVWSSQKLEEAGTYVTAHYPLAGAWSADGRTFAAGTDSSYDPDVRVFAAGAATPSRTYDFGPGVLLQPRGLALSADGSRAWAVTSSGTDTLVLRVLGATPTPTPTPATGPASLSLASDPPSFFVGETTRLGGWLSAGGTGIAGAPLSVTRSATGAAPVPLSSLTTAANGTYTFLDSPAEAGSYTYTVTWPGDGTRAGATSTESVTVHPLGTSLDLRLQPSWSNPDGVIGDLLLRSSSSTASLGGRTVHLTRQSSGTSEVLPSVTTDEWGGAEFSDVPPPGTVTYTARVDAHGSEPAATVSATLVRLVPTDLQISVPPTAAAGAPVTVSGRLGTSSGWVGGAVVSVARSGCGSTTTTTKTLMDGTWSITDGTATTGTCTWTASYAGDQVFAESTAHASTIVELRPTALTALAPRDGVAGTALTVRGSLNAGTAPVPGARVSVARSGCGASTGTAVTAADGTWAYADAEPPAGTCTYRASYAGSSTHAASSSTSTSTAVALRQPDLTVTVVRGTGSTKKLVHVTGQLAANHGNQTLTLTVQPAGGAEMFLASGTVDALGRFTATYQPKTTTTYRARFTGDDWYAARVVERTQ